MVYVCDEWADKLLTDIGYPLGAIQWKQHGLMDTKRPKKS